MRVIGSRANNRKLRKKTREKEEYWVEKLEEFRVERGDVIRKKRYSEINMF